MITIKKVINKDRDLLFNINQKYLYEMTQFYDDKIDENGNYHYGHFDEYFIDSKRSAYFIYNDNNLVGFFMIHPYSYFNYSPDYVLAEFTIFPHFRKRHYAEETIKIIFDTFPGNWEIKYNENNIKAKNLWLKVTNLYSPIHKSFSPEETVLIFSTNKTKKA